MSSTPVKGWIVIVRAVSRIVTGSDARLRQSTASRVNSRKPMATFWGYQLAYRNPCRLRSDAQMTFAGPNNASSAGTAIHASRLPTTLRAYAKTAKRTKNITPIPTSDSRRASATGSRLSPDARVPFQRKASACVYGSACDVATPLSPRNGLCGSNGRSAMSGMSARNVGVSDVTRRP